MVSWSPRFPLSEALGHHAHGTGLRGLRLPICMDEELLDAESTDDTVVYL